MSPLPVRIFWWLSVLVVMYGIAQAIWFLLIPSSHYLAVMARLPAELRSQTQRVDVINVAISVSFWSVVILSLAWLAVSRHSNLARWAIIIMFSVRELIPLTISVAYGQFHNYAGKLGQDEWVHPLIYIIPALEIVAVACLFSEGARNWFNRDSSGLNVQR